MKTQTPLERLKAKQQALRLQCRQEEQILAQEWNWIHENSGRVLLWSVREVAFPHRRKTQAGFLSNLPYYFTVLRENLSVIWVIIRPLYLKWKRARQRKKQNA